MTEPMASPAEQLSPETISFYCEAMETLQQAGVPFLVGGAYAYARYTGVVRHTKDFDVFIDPADFERALEAFSRKGWKVERNFPHWLGKTWNDNGEDFVDLIFSSGNGVARVDHLWFDHAVDEEVLGMKVKLCPAEEMIWSKAFVNERERYDGSDVNHLLLKAGPGMDWERLMRRFDRYWEVLFGHIMMFRFAYPSERDTVPDWVMAELMSRTLETIKDGNWEQKLCRGNLISRVNYQVDITRFGFEDGRAWDEREREQGDERGARSELESTAGGSR